MVERLALGTVQFGADYGVAGAGRVAPAEVARILSAARERGIDTLDTAADYGESEQVLGEAGVDRWRTVTKLSPLPAGWSDGAGWVREEIFASLRRLRLPSVEGLLLHRPEDLLGDRGAGIYAGLLECRERGLVRKIGLSIYGPETLDAILPRFPVDLVQAPFNVLDRRLRDSGWLDRLASAGIEVHARSVFLQGLLLMPAAHRPPYFHRWEALWRRWSEWLRDNEAGALQACLRFALEPRGIARVVVGVDNLGQLEKVAEGVRQAAPLAPAELATDDLDLIDPSRWRLA